MSSKQPKGFLYVFLSFGNACASFMQTVVSCWLFAPSSPVLLVLLVGAFQFFAQPANAYQFRQDWRVMGGRYRLFLDWFLAKRNEPKWRRALSTVIFIILLFLLLAFTTFMLLNAIGGVHALCMQITQMPWITWAVSVVTCVPGFLFSLVNIGHDVLNWLFLPIMKGESFLWGDIKASFRSSPILFGFQCLVAIGLIVLAYQVSGSIAVMLVSGAHKCLIASHMWVGAFAIFEPLFLVPMRIMLMLNFVKRIFSLVGIGQRSVLKQAFDACRQQFSHGVFGFILTAVAALKVWMSACTLKVLGGGSTFWLPAVGAGLLETELAANALVAKQIGDLDEARKSLPERSIGTGEILSAV